MAEVAGRNGELNRLKVNTTKTEVMASSTNQVNLKMVDSNNLKLKQVERFKYLGIAI